MERVWPDEQLALFIDLRDKSWNVRSLADHVLGLWHVGLWLPADPVVSTRQALKALRTWSWPERLGSRRISRQLARELLSGFPSLAHAALIEPLAAALKHGRPLDLDAFELPHEQPSALERRDVEAALADEYWERGLPRDLLGADEPFFRDGDVDVDELARRHVGRHPELLDPPALPPGVALVASPDLVAAVAAITRGFACLADVDELELDRGLRKIAPPRRSDPSSPMPGVAAALLRELGREDEEPQPVPTTTLEVGAGTWAQDEVGRWFLLRLDNEPSAAQPAVPAAT
jgi:hypothetical protein